MGRLFGYGPPSLKAESWDYVERATGGQNTQCSFCTSWLKGLRYLILRNLSSHVLGKMKTKRLCPKCEELLQTDLREKIKDLERK